MNPKFTKNEEVVIRSSGLPDFIKEVKTIFSYVDGKFINVHNYVLHTRLGFIYNESELMSVQEARSTGVKFEAYRFNLHEPEIENVFRIEPPESIEISIGSVKYTYILAV